jgi:hypothetical protein
MTLNFINRVTNCGGITVAEREHLLNDVFEEGENGNLIPKVPASEIGKDDALRRLMNGGLNVDNPRDFLVFHLVVPHDAEYLDPTFAKYGHTQVIHAEVLGEMRSWVWDSSLRETDGVPETDIWRMIAVASQFWRCYYEEQLDIKNGRMHPLGINILREAVAKEGKSDADSARS